MTTILITGIGGDIAQGVALIIRESFPDFRVIGTDVHDEHGGQLFCDELRTVPTARDPAWMPSLLRIADEVDAKIIVPINEVELAAIASMATDLSKSRWLAAPRVALRTCLDKLETARFLEARGFGGPWTVDAVRGSPGAFPCVIKPRSGSGSRGVHIVTSPEEASFHALRVTDPIFQELLLPADQEVTCGVHRTQSGITTVIQLRRRLVGGFTGWAEVIDDPEVESLCHRVSESLGFAGSINIQLRRTASGPRIFEINPRFSSTAVMRHRMGFQDVVWSINDMLGREVTPTRVSPGLRAVRLQNASVL